MWDRLVLDPEFLGEFARDVIGGSLGAERHPLGEAGGILCWRLEPGVLGGFLWGDDAGWNDAIALAIRVWNYNPRLGLAATRRERLSVGKRVWGNAVEERGDVGVGLFGGDLRLGCGFAFAPGGCLGCLLVDRARADAGGGCLSDGARLFHALRRDLARGHA
jgi:hypothetical protein